MGHVDFPSMPSHSPCSPEEDGYPHVRITADSVVLDYGEGGMRTLPFRGIRRDGIVVLPGDVNSVNCIQLTLFTSDITVDTDNTHNAIIRVITEGVVEDHA